MARGRPEPLRGAIDICQISHEVDDASAEWREDRSGIVYEIGGVTGFASRWRAERFHSLVVEESRHDGASVYRQLGWEHGRVWNAVDDPFARMLDTDGIRAELEAKGIGQSNLD